MRCLKRNQSKFWYCTYVGESELIDDLGHKTGEKAILYSSPVQMWANISRATGFSSAEQFGNLENYDKVIVTDDLECPIDENSVLFVDKIPEFTTVPSHRIVEATALFGEESVEPISLTIPKHDYTVRRVAKSLNSVSIAIRKVTVR